jgi:HNH endonuclease
MTAGTFAEAFWASVEKSDGCWLWRASTNGRGYGTFRSQMAHRVAYELLTGPIPDGHELDHLCDVRKCVNPSHLEPVVPRVNRLRAGNWIVLQAEQTHCRRGHRYTPETVYVDARGKRHCRPCRSVRRRAQYAELRATTNLSARAISLRI